MRAAVLEAAGKPLLVTDDVDIADPGPGQVRVSVSHCGVCHSVEPEHLLLALLRDDGNRLGGILAEKGVTLDWLRERLTSG